MPTTTRTFRVFVSSTFEDLKEERNALQSDVFPKLTELCASHGARFQAIDLRWGVRDEAAVDQKTMEICLREIERCQNTKIKPNFIVLLGNRYGWRPVPARIKADEFKRVREGIHETADLALVDSWYQLDENAVPPEYLLKPRTGEFVDAKRWAEVEDILHRALRQAARIADLSANALVKYEASATHQEILKGLGDTAEDHKHVFAFIRSTGPSDEEPGLGTLKAWLRGQIGENAFEYAAGDLGQLSRYVENALWNVILSEVSTFEARPALDLEIEAHDQFAKNRCEHFVGRELVLDQIEEYLKGDDRRVLVLHGESGSGKSAIMAKASVSASTATARDVVFRRFIGATPASSNGLILLRSLCQQIARSYEQPDDVPATFNELTVAFSDLLLLATEERPLVVFIDAIDQFGSQDLAAAMTWLPQELPPSCKIVLSTMEVPDVLKRARLLPVESFAEEEAAQALKLWLDEAGRRLQPEQHEILLTSFRRCPLPLYWKLAFEEARRWRSFEPLKQCLLGQGLAGIVSRLFSRLAEESNHGPVLVNKAIGYLTSARYGLAEDEILAVLSSDDEVWHDFVGRARNKPPERRLPVIVWSRLHLDLEPYLTERNAPGGVVIAFYHRQLPERVATIPVYHSELARYFAIQPLWLAPGCSNQRKVTELVRQQVKGGLLDEALLTLIGMSFLEAKCMAELVPDLQDDYREAIAALPEAQAELQTKRQRQITIAHWMEAIIEYAKQWSVCRERLVHGEEVCEPDVSMLEVIPSVTPWTDEQIAAESRRTVENPTRLDRLKAFAQFIQREFHPLTEFGKRPGFVLQHAWNHAPRGPVHAAASEQVSKDAVPRFLRHWSPRAKYNPTPALQRTFEGHRNAIESVAVTLDGRRALSGSQDRTLRFWDLESGACLRTLEGHTGVVWCVAMTPDGRRAVSASGDNNLRIWELNTGTCLRILQGHETEVDRVSITPDGGRAVSKSWRDKTLKLWDLDRGACIRTLEDKGEFDDVWLMPDGRRSVSGFEDGTVRIWDMETNACLSTLIGHADRVTRVWMAPDGRKALSVSDDNTIRVWDLLQERCLRVLDLDSPWELVATADALLALAMFFGDEEDALKLLDLETGACLRTLEGHTDRVSAIDVTPDGRWAVSGSWDRTLRLWDLHGGTSARSLEEHRDLVTSMAVTADFQRAVSASRDDTLRIWNLETAQCLRVLNAHTSWATAVAVTPNGRLAVSGYGAGDNALRVWDLESGVCLRVLEGHSEDVLCVALTPDGSRALSGSRDKTLRIWNLETGECLRILNEHTTWVHEIFVTSDAGRAISQAGYALRIWNLKSYECLRTLEDASGFWSVVVFADGRRAVSASADDTLKLWDLDTGTCVHIMEGHKWRTESLAVTPDGRRLISGGWDKTLRVWDIDTGRCLLVLEGHTDWVKSVAVTPDGRLVVSGSSDKTIRLWDLESSKCISIARLNATCFPVLLILPLNRVLCGQFNGEVSLFELQGVRLSPS